jgi:hypothetical protein
MHQTPVGKGPTLDARLVHNDDRVHLVNVEREQLQVVRVEEGDIDLLVIHEHNPCLLIDAGEAVRGEPPRVPVRRVHDPRFHQREDLGEICNPGCSDVRTRDLVAPREVFQLERNRRERDQAGEHACADHGRRQPVASPHSRNPFSHPGMLNDRLTPSVT